MNRRKFLAAIPLGAASVLAGGVAWREFRGGWRLGDALAPPERPRVLGAPPRRPIAPPAPEPLRDEGATLELPSAPPADSAPGAPDPHKMRNFDRPYADDFFLDDGERALLEETAAHLARAQRVIGHGHFNLVSFDELVRYGRHYGKIGTFSRAELDFLEKIFFADAQRYGFYGEKVCTEMTARIAERETRKVPGTGHYLYRGEPLEKYRRLRRDLGDRVFLTSGIRSVVKQYQLFLQKAVETAGNLSQASRSLAPPGYSYHAVGDFDVGKVGFGLDNFTDAFAMTDEYRKMIDLGYVEIRYTEANPFGVRHEPWHIKIGDRPEPAKRPDGTTTS